MEKQGRFYSGEVLFRGGFVQRKSVYLTVVLLVMPKLTKLFHWRLSARRVWHAASSNNGLAWGVKIGAVDLCPFLGVEGEGAAEHMRPSGLAGGQHLVHSDEA